MKKVIVLFVVGLLTTSSLTSCKKDCPVDEPTRTELLTAQEWVGINVVIYENDTEVINESISEAKFAFLTNFDILIYDNDEPSEIYKWGFENSEQSFKLLNYEDNSIFELYDIDELTETSLVFSFTETDGTDTAKMVYNLRH